MHVAHQPAIVHVAHNPLNRIERIVDVRHVVHGQDDARNDLDHEADRQYAAEREPVIQVLRRWEVDQAIIGQAYDRQARVEPALKTRLGFVGGMSAHDPQPTFTLASLKNA